ncbi:MAG TPA: TlpA disulfide reductase family protein [Candidatus Baltobacteraceae bacterium]|jgi:thiol-disulfide isomerase/thioredoxin
MESRQTRFVAAGVAAVCLIAVLAVPQVRAWGHRALRMVGLEQTQRPLHVGDRLTSLKLTGLDGKTTWLSNQGHPQIINVFATWCTECKAETPALARVASTLKSKGVQLIGIDQAETGTVVEQFAQSNGLRYPIYLDAGGGVTHTVLGARFIPTTIVVNGAGLIIFEHIGALTEADFRKIASAVRNAG